MAEDVQEAHLYVPAAEAAEIAGVNPTTVRRWLSSGKVRGEFRQETTIRGNTVKVAYVDLTTLPTARELAVTVQERPVDEFGDALLSVYTASSLDQAVAAIVAVEVGKRRALVGIAAERHGVSKRTAYRRVAEFENGSSSRSGRRADAGRPRVPQAARDVLLSAFVSNVPTISTRDVYWTALQAAPEAMRYERNGRMCTVSLRTAERLRQELLADPYTAPIFQNEDQRKEFLRVFSGEVVSAHANDMWQLDMTKCDLMVCDPQARQIFRPRIHAMIDVFSGCIPGVTFSRKEDQAQADLALYRSVLPKSGPFGELWPVWGLPKRLYVDNGKVYTSKHFRRILNELGVDVRNSRPRVSHTRGRIERFFGTLHGLERGLPGYLGKDAKDKDSEGIKKLTKATRAWLDGDRADPGYGHRFLTITEYQDLFFAWLVGKYHEILVHGKTRVEHFKSAVPADTLVELDRQELATVFAARQLRTVDAGGRIRIDNTHWVVPDGSLAVFKGRQVVVMSDAFALPQDRLIVAWQRRDGGLEVIGEAQPAPTAADSPEAIEHRHNARVVLVEQAKRSRRERRELENPAYRLPTQLIKKAAVTLPPELQPAAKGRLESLSPTESLPEFAPDDPLGQAILDRYKRHEDAPTDPVEHARWRMQRFGGAKGR